MSEMIRSLYPEMVERIARALCRSKRNRPQGYPDSWMENHINEHWMVFADDAKVAIHAMREPTEAMKCDGDARPWDWSCQTCGGPKEHWHRMIDEALK